MSAYFIHLPTDRGDTMQVTVFGPNLNNSDSARGCMHIHKAGCRDGERLVKRYGSDIGWTIGATSLESIVWDVYGDMIDESGRDWQDYLHELHFAPCVTLPTAEED